MARTFGNFIAINIYILNELGLRFIQGLRFVRPNFVQVPFILYDNCELLLIDLFVVSAAVQHTNENLVFVCRHFLKQVLVLIILKHNMLGQEHVKEKPLFSGVGYPISTNPYNQLQPQNHTPCCSGQWCCEVIWHPGPIYC